MGDWHFNYNIDAIPEYSLVYSKIFGVWRVDDAKSYHEDFKKESAEIIKKPWAKLVDLINWKTGTPEVIDTIGDHMRWCIDNKMVCQVYVINDPVRYGQLQKMFDRGGAKGASKTFRTRSEARKFLKDKGFGVPDSYV